MADILRKQGRTIGSSGGSGGGGLTQEEHDWLESLASYTPNMHDINPNLLLDFQDGDCYSFEIFKTTTHWELPGFNKIPVCGYKRIKLYISSAYYANVKFRFQLADGSLATPFDATNGWSDYISVPDNAVSLICSNTNNSSATLYYALFTTAS